MLRPIKTEIQYDEALERVYHLMQKEILPESNESDELEVLTILIKEYERVHYSLLKNTKTIKGFNFTNKTNATEKREHILKLISLFKLGETILGSIEDFICWIKKPSGKEGSTYLDLLGTLEGIDEVEQELKRIAEGYSA